jgi:hypothetical protein
VDCVFKSPSEQLKGQPRWGERQHLGVECADEVRHHSDGVRPCLTQSSGKKEVPPSAISPKVIDASIPAMPGERIEREGQRPALA